jgi:hypothetical protein
VEKGHDEHRKLIVVHLAPLIKKCGVEYQEILDVWEGRDPVLKAVINGPIGADRMVENNHNSMLTIGFHVEGCSPMWN